jgi:purine nucleosidase
MLNQVQFVRRTVAVLLACGLVAGLSPGFAAAQDLSTPAARAARAEGIVPLDRPVLVGKPVTFKLKVNPSNPHWNLGDGATADGSSVTHTYQEPGIYRILMGSAAAQEKMRLIIDTDACAEIDDQNAIAYALFSGNHFEVEGITVNRGSDYPERTAHRPYFGRVDIDDHFTEAANVAKMCASSDVPVLKGPAGNYRQVKGNINNATFDGSDAVNFIIQRAHAHSNRPLRIYACGNLTNVALALLKDPTIAPKIEIWWLGTEWPRNHACNNHAGDLDAVDAILANPQNVPFHIIPWPHLGVTFAEIRDRMTGRGPQVSPAVPGLRGEGPDFTCFGDYSVYLFDRFVGARQKERGRSLLDVLGFAAVKNNVGQYTPEEMGAPSFVYESAIGSEPHRHPGTWVVNDSNPRRVTMWRHPNRDAVYNDFYNTVRNYVLVDSASN